MKNLLLVLLAATASSSFAQTVFFDDFDGNALLSHWNQPPPSQWTYNISGGMLNVTDLHYPSNPHAGGNFTSMNAAYAAQSDFQLDVWMGWESGNQPHRLAIQVGGPFSGNPIIAQFAYSFESGGGPIIMASASNQLVTAPAPTPGIHHFRVSRAAGRFNFELNNQAFASIVDAAGTPAAAVWLMFVGPYPGPVGAFHVDRVLVVPAPSGPIVLFAGMAGLLRRRRCRM